jgi:hypothetical protein
MGKFLLRALVAVIANAVVIYSVAILAVWLLIPNSEEGGLIMMSPLGIAILGLFLPSVFFGLVNGIFIAAMPERTITSIGSSLKWSFIAATVVGLILTALIFATSSGEERYTDGKLEYFVPVVFVLLCFVANVATVYLVKMMFFHRLENSTTMSGEK